MSLEFLRGSTPMRVASHAGIAATALAVLLWKHPNPLWLISAGAAIGIAHSLL